MTDSDGPGNARLCTRDITRSYNSAPVFAGISLTIGPGEAIAVIGPSGPDRSALPCCTSGVLLPDDGDVVFGDTKINLFSDVDRSALHLRDFGFIFQDGQPLPELTARENVALPMAPQGKKRSRSLKLTDDVLNRLGSADFTRRRPGQMSDGRAWCVTIARVMAGEPGVILANEPAGTLGRSTGHEVMQQLITLMKQTSTTLVMVTHDVRVADWCRQCVEIRDGLIYDDRILAGVEIIKRAPQLNQQNLREFLPMHQRT